MSASSSSVTSSSSGTQSAKTLFCSSADEKKVKMWNAVEKMFKALAFYSAVSFRYNKEGTYTIVGSSKISKETIGKMLGDEYEGWNPVISGAEANGDHKVSLIDASSGSASNLSSASSKELSRLTLLSTSEDTKRIKMLNALIKVLEKTASWNNIAIEGNVKHDLFNVYSFQYCEDGSYLVVSSHKTFVMPNFDTDYEGVKLVPLAHRLYFLDKESTTAQAVDAASTVGGILHWCARAITAPGRWLFGKQ